MCKLFSTMAIFCCIFFIACNKESQIIPATQDSSLGLTKAIMSLKSSDARRTSFADHLSNEEKVLFVSNRLDLIITDLQLDEKQIAVINELKAFLKPELYEQGSPLNLKALQYETEWKERALQVFSKDQLAYIFSFRTLSEFKTAISKTTIKSSTRAGAEDCDCSTQSDWCSSGRSCGGPACGFQSYACGTLYLYHCDGLCS